MSDLGVAKTSRGNWMSTYTGRQYYPFDPRPEEVVIKDIAVGLSNEARFGGQCRFFSVAEHSVNVSYYVPDRHKLTALLHDAPEAYIGDIIRPIKLMPEFKAVYGPLEQKSWEAIAKRFDLDLGEDFAMPEVVHHADNLALCNEARYLKHVHWNDWPLLDKESELIAKIDKEFLEEEEEFDYSLFDTVPACLTPEEAAECFLNRFGELIRLEIIAHERRGSNVIKFV